MSTRCSIALAKDGRETDAPRKRDRAELQRLARVDPLQPCDKALVMWRENTVVKEFQLYELAIQRKFRHPNILPVKRFDAQKLEMPIAWGGSLFNMLMSDSTRIHTKHLASIIHQVANAVMHCHAQGVYHLDIKVDNILLLHGVYNPQQEEAPHVCLGDFGVSCVPHSLASPWNLYNLGTPDFSPPERLREARATLTAARAQAWDVWTMGLLVWNVFTCAGLMRSDWIRMWGLQSLARTQHAIDAVLNRKNAVPDEWMPAVKAALRADWKARPTMRAWRALLPPATRSTQPLRIRQRVDCQMDILMHVAQQKIKALLGRRGAM